MRNDMVLALNEASANRTTLLGLNHHAEPGQRSVVQIIPGMMHDTGDMTQTSTLAIPQARQSFTTLGIQPAGAWGFTHGVNEHRVAVGVTGWKSKRCCGTASEPCYGTLTGPDLARLALERSRSAHHAFEVLVDLLEHHGEAGEQGANDHIFAIADPNEAFVLEASGRFWAMLECGSTRAITDAAMIRQDWRRLAPGLVDYAIEKGWWNDDGTKIDFVRCLGDMNEQTLAAQRRWGHFSLALAQQQGAIDLYFLRHMLAEQGEGRTAKSEGRASGLPSPRRGRGAEGDVALATDPPSAANSAFLVELTKAEQPLVVWLSLGSARVGLYFPLCLVGELPAGFGDSIPASPSIQERMLDLETLALGKEKDRHRLTAALERLQTRFDQDADDFLAKAHDYQLHGKPYLIGQLATEMMHHHVEIFHKEHCSLTGAEDKLPPAMSVSEEVLFFA